MNAEFNWWLLTVGLVAGAGLVWLVIADWSRREEDVAEDEVAIESAWIAQSLRERGADIDPEAAGEVLALHREYLRLVGVLDAEPAGDDETALPADDTDWVPETDDADDRTTTSVRAVAPDTMAGEAPERRSVRSMPLSPRDEVNPPMRPEPDIPGPAAEVDSPAS